MKIILFNSFSGFCISCIIFCGDSNGQLVNTTDKYQRDPLSEQAIVDSHRLNIKLGSGFTFINDISTKAVQNFISCYPEVTDVKWFKSSCGLTGAYFEKDNTRTWAYYDKTGICHYIIRHYYEEKLSAPIKELLRDKFPGFCIFHISEVTKNEKIAYVVKLQNKTSWKTVKIIGDEMEVVEEYWKS